MKILWIPHAAWRIPQRAHLFCQALSEKHEVHVTDMVADFVSVRDYFSWMYLKNFFYRHYRDQNITVHGIPRISPAIFSKKIRKFNDRLFTRTIQKIHAKYKFDVIVSTFVVSPPLNNARLIFDLFDDNVAIWRSRGKYLEYATEIEEIEREYVKHSDAIVAVSSVLAEKYKKENANIPVHVIPNGVNLARFNNFQTDFIRQRLGISKPLVGIVGNHDSRMEIDIILDVARKLHNQGINFLIAGRGSMIPYAQKKVEKLELKNVYFLGYVPFEKIPNVVGSLDVGLCIYEKSVGADARSPMKLFDYSAVGLPVVCTVSEEVKRMGFENVVLVDDDSDSFVAGVLEALDKEHVIPSRLSDYDTKSLVSCYEAVLKSN